RPSATQLRALRQGVMLEDGVTAPAGVELVRGGHETSDLRITMHEGRKRQIKRMCALVGHPVARLHRVQVGPLTLGDLECGRWRELSAAEVTALRRGAGLDEC